MSNVWNNKIIIVFLQFLIAEKCFMMICYFDTLTF